MERAARGWMAWTYWGVCAALVGVVAALAWVNSPQDERLGTAQSILYIHYPVAIDTFVACFVVFCANIACLWQRRARCDMLGLAAARVAVGYCTVLLVTGMLWAHNAWGVWWTWSPRLTFSLFLWVFYVAYLVIRAMIDRPDRRATISAVYGALTFLDVPLVYLSVKLLPDVHPEGVRLDPSMLWTLRLAFVPATMICAGLIWGLYRREMRHLASEIPEHEARPGPLHGRHA